MTSARGARSSPYDSGAVLPGTPVEFREYGHHIFDNRAGIEVHPVEPRAEPGSIKAQLSSAPTKGAELSPDPTRGTLGSARPGEGDVPGCRQQGDVGDEHRARGEQEIAREAQLQRVHRHEGDGL